jgi:hypothetical protein
VFSGNLLNNWSGKPKMFAYLHSILGNFLAEGPAISGANVRSFLGIWYFEMRALMSGVV